jgi:hypothetical protein
MSTKKTFALMLLPAVLLPMTGLQADVSHCPVVSAGAETDGVTGSVQNLGQVLIGRASNGAISMHAGAIPCYTACSVLVIADLDRDCDVDTDDFALWVACASRAEVSHGLDCDIADFDGDGDVDLDDFATLQRCYSGPGNLPDHNCAE